MSSGFSIKTLETKAVVPNKVPRIVCGRTNFHIAPNNSSILSRGEASATRTLLFDEPENASVLIFRLYSLLLAVLQIPGAANLSSHSSVIARIVWPYLLLIAVGRKSEVSNRDDDDDDDNFWW